MKTSLDRQLTYYILGVPRTGTTIVASLFNSLTDGFCLMEPHWYEKSQNGRDIDFFQELPTWNDGYSHLAGYKETYRPNHKLCERLIQRHTPLVDFFIVVFRNPVKTHSSQKALGWTEWDHPLFFNGSYQRLDKLLREWAGKGIAVVYEDFVQNPLGYLNARLPFQIEGPLEIRPTNALFGDPFANRSSTIQMSGRETCIPQRWIKMHSMGIAIWRKYRISN